MLFEATVSRNLVSDVLSSTAVKITVTLLLQDKYEVERQSCFVLSGPSKVETTLTKDFNKGPRFKKFLKKYNCISCAGRIGKLASVYS